MRVFYVMNEDTGTKLCIAKDDHAECYQRMQKGLDHNCSFCFAVKQGYPVNFNEEQKEEMTKKADKLKTLLHDLQENNGL